MNLLVSNIMNHSIDKDLSIFLLSATASFDDHVLIVFKDYFIEVVDVQHGNGRQLGRHAARPWHGSRINGIDERLHDGVIRRV